MRWNVSTAGLAASWGVISVIVAHVRLSAETLVLYRLAIAGITMAVGLVLTRNLRLFRVPRGRAQLGAVSALLALHWFLFFETIKLSSVAVALVTVYTAPLFLAVLAPVVLPEGRSAVALAAVVPGAAGIGLIALGGNGGSHARPLAVATGLGAGLTYALLVIATKRLVTQLPVLTITAWNYTTAALVLAPFTIGARIAPHPGEVGYLILLGAVFTALSGVVYVWLLGKVTAQAIGILAYLEPVSAALLAWALLGQALGWQVVAGGLLVLAAGLVVVFYEPAGAPGIEPAAVGLTGE